MTELGSNFCVLCHIRNRLITQRAVRNTRFIDSTQFVGSPFTKAGRNVYYIRLKLSNVAAPVRTADTTVVFYEHLSLRTIYDRILYGRRGNYATAQPAKTIYRVPMFVTMMINRPYVTYSTFFATTTVSRIYV